MQRVISLQTSRNADRGSSEFVTKRLCCSFLFSAAFLSLLGGFLLGRYATDRAIVLKKALLQKQQNADKFSHEIMNNLTLLMDDIHLSIAHTHVTDFDAYLRKLNCTDVDGSLIQLPRNTTNFDASMPSDLLALKTTRILNRHLDLLGACFVDIQAYIRGIQRDQSNKNLISSITSD